MCNLIWTNRDDVEYILKCFFPSYECISSLYMKPLLLQWNLDMFETVYVYILLYKTRVFLFNINILDESIMSSHLHFPFTFTHIYYPHTHTHTHTHTFTHNVLVQEYSTNSQSYTNPPTHLHTNTHTHNIQFSNNISGDMTYSKTLCM